MRFDPKKNIDNEKATDSKEICFEKKRDLSVDFMCCTEYVFPFLLTSHKASLQAYHRRRDAVSRCAYKSITSIHSYLSTWVVSANFLSVTMARTTT